MSASPPDPTEPAVDDASRSLLAACIDALAAGGSQAVEDLLQQPANASLAAAVRERLAKLQRAGLLQTDTEANAAIPERLGEYRLLRRLGAGGMGVVYLAEQPSLGRHVALKLLRPEQRYFPGARERFRREVEAIARLGDPGIVPIYAVGEADGIQFFTMEHVRGATLADVLAATADRAARQLSGRDFAAAVAARASLSLPTPLAEVFAGSWLQTCCRLVARMARAVHHAHERGIVHRDLKPSNAMVTPDGRVLLLDFGLAAATGTARITRTGAQLGTLHYMAPEQLLDGEVAAHTDVYALGATLYELLAQAPPFQASSAERLRSAILDGSPVALRSRNHEVPRDVDTICRCAMDRDPGRRYRSAAALASDLENFLAHRPIQARPAGPLLRLRRWSRRHPTAAALSLLFCIAGTGAPWLIHNLQQDAAAAQANAEAAARVNLHNAVAALARMLQQSRDPTLASTPGLDDLRRQQVAQAIDLIEDLYRQNPTDSQVAVLYLRGSIHAAQLRQQFGEHAAALATLDGLRPLLARLRSERPLEQGLLIDHCGLQMARGSSLVGLGQLPAAARTWQDLLDEFADLQLTASDPRLLIALTSCFNNLSRLHHAQGDDARALAVLQQGLELDRLVLRADRSLPVLLDSARTRINHGTLLRKVGQAAAAHSSYSSVVEDLSAVAAKGDRDPELRRELARARFCLAELAMANGEAESAQPLQEAALTALRGLVADFPDRIAYLQDLGKMLFQAGCSMADAGAKASAIQLLTEAIASHERLLERQPAAPEPRSEWTTFAQRLGELQAAQGDAAAALATLSAAVVQQQRLVADFAADPHFRWELGSLQQSIGVLEMRREAWPAARTAWRAAADSYEAALAAGYERARAPRALPLALQVLAQVELMCDDLDAVLDALRRLQRVQPLRAEQLAAAGQLLHVEQHAGFAALLAEARERDASGGEQQSSGQQPDGR